MPSTLLRQCCIAAPRALGPGRGPAAASPLGQAAGRCEAATAAPRSHSLSTLSRAAPSARPTERTYSSAWNAPRRAFSTTRSAWSNSSQAVRDSRHPTGLYYHPHSQGTWLVSLLPDTPSSAEAASVLGTLSAPSNSASPSGERISPESLAAGSAESFTPNPQFLELLHKTLEHDVVPQDAVLETEAQNRESGWAHLTGEHARRVLFQGGTHDPVCACSHPISHFHHIPSRPLRQCSRPKMRAIR